MNQKDKDKKQSCYNCVDQDVCVIWNLIKNVQYPVFIEDQIDKKLKLKRTGLIKAARHGIARKIGKNCELYMETCGSEFFDKKKKLDIILEAANKPKEK